MNPISVLLGAGASVPYGVPMMKEFYVTFKHFLTQRYPSCADLVGRLERRSGRQVHDLETLMTDLLAVAGIPEGLKKLGAEAQGISPDIAKAQETRGYLDAFIVDTCEAFDRSGAEKEVARLFSLCELGPLWVFTTNYDRVVEHAAAEGDVPFTDGFEDPIEDPVSDWTGSFDHDVRIVKLHGSVNWYEDNPRGQLHRLDRGYSLPGHDFRLVQGDQVLRPLMIIPTLEKEATKHPYTRLATHFGDVLRDVRVLLIIGSSLRDDHIRGVIETRMSGLNVLLVNPDAGNLVPLLGDSQRVHGVSAGTSEFLHHGLDKLLEWARDAGEDGLSDEEVASQLRGVAKAIERTIAEEEVWNQSPELARVRGELADDHVTTRRTAIDRLSNHRHPAVMRRVQEILANDSHPEVRVGAVSVLMEGLGTLAIPALKKAAHGDDSVMVRREAVLAVGMLLPEVDARECLSEISKGDDPVAAQMARELLEEEAEDGREASYSEAV